MLLLFLQNLINGLLLGGLYVSIAIGFSLVWGVLNIINMIHGSLIVLGSYIAYYAFVSLGVSPSRPTSGASCLSIHSRPGSYRA
jgi:branched-chain amino acid transport system permease protein